MTRRRAAYAIITLLMAVTVGHVASFTGSMEIGGWILLGWPYALAVDAAIVLCQWFTRWKTTRTWAWSGYFAFTAASGALNVASVQPWAHQLAWAAWIYALFPTVAIALLGFLARDVEKLAEHSERSKHRKTHPATQSNGHKPHTCAWCGKELRSLNALSAHKRWCAAYQEREREKVSE